MGRLAGGSLLPGFHQPGSGRSSRRMGGSSGAGGGGGSDASVTQMTEYERYLAKLQDEHINIFRQGLNIGSFPSSQDIVRDGLPFPHWMPWEHGTVYRANDDATTFYIQYHDGKMPFSLPKFLVQPPIVNVTVSGEVSEAQELSGNPLSMVINYECKVVGTTIITMDIPVDSGAMRMAWEKICGDPLKIPSTRFAAPFLPRTPSGMAIYMAIIVAVLLCCCGCLFKYCVYHSKFFQAMPFYDTCANCCGQMGNVSISLAPKPAQPPPGHDRYERQRDYP
eukprot:GFYU01004298.1.p1 GENE.GFYU01004298.1~~GFYU01004298.1.p1  ORF type:complete len:295 (-),score=105.98 GFYU01004298.1:465-1301(-)